MIRYVLAMGKQHLGPHVVVGHGIKIFWPGLFITSPDHLETSWNGYRAFAWLWRVIVAHITTSPSSNLVSTENSRKIFKET